MTEPARVYVRVGDGEHGSDVPLDEKRAEQTEQNTDADLDERERGTVVNGRRHYPSQGELRAIELERMQRDDNREVTRLSGEGRQASEIVSTIESEESQYVT